MPKLIEAPSIVQAAGTKPKRIEELVGRVNTDDAAKDSPGARWRTHLTGECIWRPIVDLPGQKKAGNIYYDGGHHFATDGKRKFIRHPKSGTEQFFDLEEDPDECRDLTEDPDRSAEIAVWREILYYYTQPENPQPERGSPWAPALVVPGLQVVVDFSKSLSDRLLL
jgi:hypothetical protein